MHPRVSLCLSSREALTAIEAYLHGVFPQSLIKLMRATTRQISTIRGLLFTSVKTMAPRKAAGATRVNRYLYLYLYKVVYPGSGHFLLLLPWGVSTALAP